MFVNFLLQVSDPDRKSRLIERLEQLPTSRVLFDRWMSAPVPDDKFEAAVRYFYILRQSVVPSNNEKSGWRFGKVKSGAVDYQNAVAKLDAFAKRILRVNFECKDFRYIIDKYDGEDSFLFCDPQLGDKVVFKKAKHNPKVLRDLTYQVSDYVQKLRIIRGYTVNLDTIGEVVVIHAKLSDEQIVQLQNKFGTDILKITNEEPPPAIVTH